MLEIVSFTLDGQEKDILTDAKNPIFHYSARSDKEKDSATYVKLECNGWIYEGKDEIYITYNGEPFKPFQTYEAKITIRNSYNEETEKTLSFDTGYLGGSFKGRWISDPQYTFSEKKISPLPLTFKKELKIAKKIKKAYAYVTSFGIYDLHVGEEKINKNYFAPGFTSYANELQYQRYDIKEALEKNQTIYINVAGGWAVGSFVFTRKNRISADKQALLCDIHIFYEDGSKEVAASDQTWEVSHSSPFLEADLYDGEIYDGRKSFSSISYHQAGLENPRLHPELLADYSSKVIEHETLIPTFLHNDSNNDPIFDFGQNFAGIVRLHIKNAIDGAKILVKHAEILQPNGDLNTIFLRSAKCRFEYICKNGEQTYSPTFTYMGFRYISLHLEGIELKDIEIEGIALYSDLKQIGFFECSNEMINKLNSNIIWSSKSNFMDIPTDCPQRDERMGWTGDIAVFSPTALFNFEMTRFLKKWLLDLRKEQNRGGGFPNTVPVQGYGVPATMPRQAIDWWGDVSILLPYNAYLATGDISFLKENYSAMKKYVKACKFWANLFSFGKNRYIWKGINAFHFGDWIAPGVNNMAEWQARHPWTATASLYNTSSLLSKIAGILGKKEDEKKYFALSEKVKDAYISVFTDGNGKLHNEFQTAYVLPLYLNMFSNEAREKAVKNLVSIIEKASYCIGTGFPGTPYILFALADNGEKDTAYRMLLNTKCPSWLYEVKVGATTIWERWDGLDENGECEIKDDGTGSIPMISYNHYASGAVGDFLYKRIAGVSPLEPGYKTVSIKPLLGGDLTYAKAKTMTPYGSLSSSWRLENNKLIIEVDIPFGGKAIVTFPNGKEYKLESGKHSLEENI